MVQQAGVKYKQSESEVRLNNWELKVELIISEFNKIINAPRVSQLESRGNWVPQSKQGCPRVVKSEQAHVYPGELPYLLSTVWQSGNQDPEQSLYIPEAEITQGLELLHLQKFWFHQFIVSPGTSGPHFRKKKKKQLY